MWWREFDQGGKRDKKQTHTYLIRQKRCKWKWDRKERNKAKIRENKIQLSVFCNQRPMLPALLWQQWQQQHHRQVKQYHSPILDRTARLALRLAPYDASASCKTWFEDQEIIPLVAGHGSSLETSKRPQPMYHLPSLWNCSLWSL